MQTPSDEINWTGDAKKDELSFYHIREKLKSYERIQIENLLQELTNKTHLIEKLIQEKKDAERKYGDMKEAVTLAKKKDLKRPVSPHRRFPDIRWNISFDPSQGNNAAGAAEPAVLTRTVDAQEFTSKLMAQNHALQRLLQEHNIEIPKEFQPGKVAFTIPETPLTERANSARSLSTIHRRPVSARPSHGSGSPFVIPQISKSRPDSGIASQRTSAFGASRPGTADVYRNQSRPTSSRMRDLQWPKPPRRPGSGFSERPTSGRSLPRLESADLDA